MGYGVDSTFSIGWGHGVCQDYCSAQLIALCNKHYPLLLVSDGCSSSPNTDIGARLVVRAGLVNAPLLFHGAGDDRELWEQYGMAVAATLRAMATALALPAEGTDATLLYGVGDGTLFRVGFYGDGCAIVRNRTGETRALEVGYESGAPRYLSYRLDPVRTDRYGEEFPGRVVIRTYRDSGAGFVPEGETTREVGEPVTFTWPEREISLVVLASDGLGSFTGTRGEAVPLPEVLPQVTSFKGMVGEFLRRRITRMKGELEKRGIRHFDDLGLAACALGPVERGEP
jgi:hypothetical protein